MKEDTGTILSMVLSSKRQSFCTYIAVDGLNPTEAYIKAFNVTSERKHTATEAGSRLMKLATIQQQIETLQASISDKLASEVVWDKAKIISELAINVEASREVNQFAASSRAIELIGKAVNVFQPETQQVNIAIIETLGKLPDSVLASLESLSGSTGTEGPSDSMDTIEASNYQILEPDSEAS